MNKPKKFDCVEMKNKIQARIYEETKTMTWEQIQEYLKKNIESSPLASKWERIKERQAKKKKAS